MGTNSRTACEISHVSPVPKVRRGLGEPAREGGDLEVLSGYAEMQGPLGIPVAVSRGQWGDRQEDGEHGRPSRGFHCKGEQGNGAGAPGRRFIVIWEQEQQVCMKMGASVVSEDPGQTPGPS